jgi:glutamine amidotransferase
MPTTRWFEGMGWIQADVRLRPNDPLLRVPQIGWNEVEIHTNCPVFHGLPRNADFYFVHSYFMDCDDPGDVAVSCDYGGPVTAGVVKGNIVATQFHPEKSQDHGLKVLENFLEWHP